MVWHLPGAVQYLSQWQERAGDSETGMGTHSPPWVTQPWGHGIWPCLMARCGVEAARNSLVFPGQVNRFQFYHKLVSPHG